MAWLTTADATNKIVDRVYQVPDSVTYYSSTGAPTTWARTLTVTEYRHVGMEQASAIAAAATILADSEADYCSAIPQRENDAGAWMIRVVEKVVDIDWA